MRSLCRCAEIYACAMRDVYTFGPTFRAEAGLF
jgi:aspartyl/asparaginyl-tRNA synthetase